MRFNTLFDYQKPIIGMVHLLSLPETPGFTGNLDNIFVRAEADAAALIEAGVQALLIENFGDEPYLISEPTPTQLAVMASAASTIRRMTDLPIGINVQFNAWQAEIAIAYACQAQFVRVEVFVDSVMSAQGMVLPCSAQITRYRKMLGADNIQIWADVQTKYTQNLLPQSLTQSALDAQLAGADALIVTGAATGQATPLEAVAEVKKAVTLPVLVGSGTSAKNVTEVLTQADGAIVGSALKEQGSAYNPVSPRQAQAFMAAVSHQNDKYATQ